MGFFRFERPINEKEFNLSILSRGKEILDHSANISIILFADASQHSAPFFKIYRPATTPDFTTQSGPSPSRQSGEPIRR